MVDISKISDGTNNYDIKDATARAGLSSKQDTLVSGTNIKTINGNSLLGSGNIIIGSSGTIALDEETITQNSDDELQAVGIKNQNTSTGSLDSLQFWEGTKEQWEVGGITDTYHAWVGGNGTIVDPSKKYSTSTNTAAYSGTYANGVFLMVGKSSVCYSSTDGGNNWTKSSISNSEVRKTIYGNNEFIIKSKSLPLAYSTDNGQSWTNGTGITGYAICWTGEYYINASYNEGYLYYTQNVSSDWIQSGCLTGSATQAICYCEYGNKKLIICIGDNGVIDYTTLENLVGRYSGNLNVISESTSDKWYEATYHNGKIVVVGLNCTGVIDITGDTPVFIRKNNITAASVIYLNNMFYAIGNYTSYPSAPITSNTLYYIREADILDSNCNWLTYTLPETMSYTTLVTDGQKLILNDGQSNKYVRVKVENEVFTLELEPTTQSIVYSAPNVISNLTINETGTGTITLSDDGVYSYTSADNIDITHTVSESYPEIMCNVEETGLIKGSKPIAVYAKNFTGTNGILAGSAGLVPAPSESKVNTVLRSDGTWGTYGLQNNASESSHNLNILGTINSSTSMNYSTALGYQSKIGHSCVVAVGYLSEGNGYYSTALGYHARANSERGIQIGYGDNNLADTLCVGFRNLDNYQLLDGTTGKIPNDRINVDTTPTQYSNNFLTSGAIYNVLGDIENVLDNIISQGSSS
jgi:hypothetical protein